MTAAWLVLALLAAPGAPKRLAFIEDDYATALALAKKSKLPLFIDAWAPWCHTCVFMREHVFNRPELGKHAERFVFLSIDTEKEKSAPFLQQYPIEFWPTLFIVDSSQEAVVIKWPGSANVEQLGKLLEDGEKALKPANQPKGSPEQSLATADRLYGEKKTPASIAAYREALAAMKADHPRRPRTVESLLNALKQNGAYQDCVNLALTEVAALPKGPSLVNAVYLGLACQAAADPKEPWKQNAGAKLYVLGQDALKIDGILADDRSGLYEVLVDYLTVKGDKKESSTLAAAWLDFLEAEAAKAPTAAARAVFDPHRLGAALASGQPQRVVAALTRSEQDLPEDYNPPARLAVAYRELGKLDQALAAADRAMTKVYGPRKLRVMETKASILEKKGDLPGQKKILTEAVGYAKALPLGQRNGKTVARLEGQLSKLK